MLYFPTLQRCRWAPRDIRLDAVGCFYSYNERPRCTHANLPWSQVHIQRILCNLHVRLHVLFTNTNRRLKITQCQRLSVGPPKNYIIHNVVQHMYKPKKSNVCKFCDLSLFKVSRTPEYHFSK